MGHRYSITTEGEEALAAATAETVLIITGAGGCKARLVAYGIAFDGTSSSAEPVQVTLKRGNSASQGTSSAATEEKHDPDDPSAACAGFHSFTVEPTYTGQPLRHHEVHPQGGFYELWRGDGEKNGFVLDNTTNSFLGLVITAPAAVNAVAWMEWDE